MTKHAQSKANPLSGRELVAIEKTCYGKLDPMIRRLVATIKEQPQTKYVEVHGPTRWLGWPDLDPVHRSANDFLRLAMMALSEYELMMVADDRIPYEVKR